MISGTLMRQSQAILYPDAVVTGLLIVLDGQVILLLHKMNVTPKAMISVQFSGVAGWFL